MAKANLYINVPIQALQEVRQDLPAMSCLALAVAIKSFSPSSVYLWQSQQKFCADFHCGATKAAKLLAHIEHSPLFRLEHLPGGRLRITARCFRHQYAQTMNYRHRPTLHMNVYKADCRQRGQIRLSVIERELKLALLLYDINARNRQDEFITKHPTQRVSHAERFLSVNGLATVTGRCPRTVMRQTRLLESEHKVAVQRSRRQFNQYQILDWDVRLRCQHIIYGHRKRLSPQSAGKGSGKFIYNGMEFDSAFEAFCEA